ncbi:MAG: T9SS type A sorting domain-containing protein [Bacteroidota bacterium]
MKFNSYLLMSGIIILMMGSPLRAQDKSPVFPVGYQVDTRIDNMGYWQRCAEAGLVPVQPVVTVPPARFTGSKLKLSGTAVVDSPDILVTNEPSNSTQSENSIVVSPNSQAILLNSNNSTPQPSNGTVKGADALKSLDTGATWTGTVEGAGGSNSGDPAAVIDLNGRWFVGYIDNGNGQSVSYSDDNGATWTVKKVGNGTALNMLDKNHLWVDIGPASPYKGYLYDGWMVNNNISISYSSTNGASWSPPVAISAGTAAGSHNQGINFKCSPEGDVYAAWAVYDSWTGTGSPEKAVGFAKSTDGGATWQPAFRAINNIKGIRSYGVSQNMRVNSFPSMAVDLSNSPYRGSIYIVWTNVGYPGVNAGTGTSVYMIRSTDKGNTWSPPIRVNTDTTAGKHHYQPWITVDQVTGYVSVVFYDNRNCLSTEAEAWMAYSTDGGTTFADLKVSDVTFTPSPIPQMATKYMGDYLGISAYNGKAFPCWTDTRSGHCLTYISPIDITIPVASVALSANILNDATFGNNNGLIDYGETELMTLKMKDVGTAAADSVKVYLSCDNSYVTMIDSVRNYGHFDIGQEKSIADGYKFKVNDSIPNNVLLTFTVKAVDLKDSITWSTFQYVSHAPDVSIMSMNILDPAPGGNNNGRLDPGESVNVQIVTKNQGIWDAENVVSTLTSLNNYVTVGNHTVNIGTLHAGETVMATFPVTVNSAAAIGSAARFHNVATSKYRLADKYFVAKIGLIVEDWETATFTKFPWQFTDPTKPWTIDPVKRYEKLYSARSGVIGNSESSGIFLNYNVAIDDSISFYKYVSCQPFVDNMKFYIDGAMVGLYSNTTDTNFRRVAFPVVAGPHTFKWVYNKDAATAANRDAAWTDFIVFPPRYITTATAGENAEICENSTYALHGLADSYDSLKWTTSGNGVFSNPAILDPIYTPGSQDIATGHVQLTLTAYGQNSIDTTSSLTLTITKIPAAAAGGNKAVCIGNTLDITASTASNYTSLQWTTKGDGSFDQAGILHPVYTPGPQDKIHGSVKLKVTATSGASCPTASDSLLLTINPLPLVDLGKDTLACADKVVTLSVATPNINQYLWLPSNKTTQSIDVDSTGVGLHSVTIKVIITDDKGCSNKDSVKVTFEVCGGITELNGVSLQVYPNPNNGMFTLEVATTHAEKLDISILGSTGEMLWSRSGVAVNGVAKENLNLSQLPQGAYLIQLSDGHGKMTRKLLIQR